MSEYFRPKGRKAKYIGDKPTPISFRVMPEQKAGLMKVAVDLGYSNYSDLLKEVVDNIISDNGQGMNNNDAFTKPKVNELYTFLATELRMYANVVDVLEDKLAQCQGALMVAFEEIDKANSNALFTVYKKPSYEYEKIASESDDDNSENAEIFLSKLESNFGVEGIDGLDLDL